MIYRQGTFLTSAVAPIRRPCRWRARAGGLACRPPGLEGEGLDPGGPSVHRISDSPDGFLGPRAVGPGREVLAMVQILEI